MQRKHKKTNKNYKAGTTTTLSSSRKRTKRHRSPVMTESDMLEKELLHDIPVDALNTKMTVGDVIKENYEWRDILDTIETEADNKNLIIFYFFQIIKKKPTKHLYLLFSIIWDNPKFRREFDAWFENTSPEIRKKYSNFNEYKKMYQRNH